MRPLFSGAVVVKYIHEPGTGVPPQGSGNMVSDGRCSVSYNRVRVSVRKTIDPGGSIPNFQSGARVCRSRTQVKPKFTQSIAGSWSGRTCIWGDVPDSTRAYFEEGGAGVIAEE